MLAFLELLQRRVNDLKVELLQLNCIEFLIQRPLTASGSFVSYSLILGLIQRALIDSIR